MQASINPRKMWESKGHYDLIVVGAGPAGIGASIAAARRGLRVALIESFGFAGGVGTQSLCPIYFGFGVEGRQTTAGLSEEFVRRMDDLGASTFFLYDSHEVPEYSKIGDRPLTTKVLLDGEVMKLVYNRMLVEAGVAVYYYTHMAEVFTENGRIVSLLLSALEGNYLLEADSFIDATGNAQLAFLADKDAVRVCSVEDGMHNSMFFIVDGVKDFDHDRAKQIYKEAREAGRLPEKSWPHFGFATLLKRGMLQIAVCFDIGNGADSCEMTRMELVMRENVFKVLDFLKREIPGFEDCYLTATPSKIGVRTSRSIVSACDFNIDTLMSDNYHHPVALCRRIYGMHSNSTKSFSSSWTSGAGGIGAVPMETLVSAKFENLLAAGRCIGSEPKLIGTFRMMNTCMTLGEAAGLMAVIAKNGGKSVDKVSYDELYPMLCENGFILKA